MSKQATPFVERLPCPLAATEMSLKSKELANAINTRDALTLEKSLSAQRYAKEIKEVERRIGDLAEEVRHGVEYRQIRVVERKDFEANRVVIIRTDTNEPCGQRAMRSDERQAEMFPKNGKPATDTQLALGAAEELGPDDDEEEPDDGDEPIEESAGLEH